MKASTRLEQQIRVLSVCVCPGTLHYILQHYSVAPQGALVGKKKHSVVFEISSIGLEIAGRWPCKVDQSLSRPCHIVLNEYPALKCPETAGVQVLVYFSLWSAGQILYDISLRFSLLSKADFVYSGRIRL